MTAQRLRGTKTRHSGARATGIYSRPVLYPVVVVLGLVVSSCGSGAGNGAIDFGDPYEVETSLSAASPDIYPFIEQDTVFIRVSFSGGCRDHDFDLEHRVSKDTAKLWLYHDANGDDCEEYVQDEYRYPLPHAVTEKPVVVLLEPAGGPPHMLQWGSLP